MRFKNMLLIDDDQEDSELFSMALKDTAPSVDLYYLNSAILAISQMNAKELSPEVILVDLNMPLMSGEQFLIAMRKLPELVSIPVYVLTTSSDDFILKRAVELGATAAFTKPSSFEGLKALIESIIN